MGDSQSAGALKLGWAQASITPDEPVQLAGQFYVRISEGVADPITATVLVLEAQNDHAVFVSCDLVCIADPLRDDIRARLQTIPGLDPAKIIFHATHTHTAPEIRTPESGAGHTSVPMGVKLDAMDPADYDRFAVERIADAITRAWNARAPGAISHGTGFAVIGRNRRWVDTFGHATMYGKTNTPTFAHIEGYEDHSIGFLATYDPQHKLTGLLVNVPCPSQVSENTFQVSADYWHETRLELRRRFGENLFILPQCSAAGDQSPHLLFDKPANERMLRLKGRTVRQEIAHRIADAAGQTLPFLAPAADHAPRLQHRTETLALPMTRLTEADVRTALAEAEQCRLKYEAEKQKLQADPALRQQPRWYCPITDHYRRMNWLKGVEQRFALQNTTPTLPAELHVLTIADAAFVTVPFEYYLDFGIAIKARSPATQTFLVQLAGRGTYCPSPRSILGGGYGSLPASNPTGPQAGQQLVRRSLDLLNDLSPK